MNVPSSGLPDAVPPGPGSYLGELWGSAVSRAIACEDRKPVVPAPRPVYGDGSHWVSAGRGPVAARTGDQRRMEWNTFAMLDRRSWGGL